MNRLRFRAMYPVSGLRRAGRKDTGQRDAHNPEVAPCPCNSQGGAMEITEVLGGKPDGLSLNDISIATGKDSDTVRIALKQLVKEGVIGEKGKTRGHRYYLMSLVVLGTKDVPKPEAIPLLLGTQSGDGDPSGQEGARPDAPPPSPKVNDQEIREMAIRLVRLGGRMYSLYLERLVVDAFPMANPKVVRKIIKDLGQNDGIEWKDRFVISAVTT